MSVAEEKLFETTYLENDDLFERVQIIEDELIEDYVKGDLTARERQLFEQHYFASAYRRAKVDAARELVKVCSSQPFVPAAANDRTQSHFISALLSLWVFAKQHLTLGFGVAAALLLLSGSGLVFELLRVHRQLAVANEERRAFERRAEEAERRLARESGQLTGGRKEQAEIRGKPGDVSGHVDRSEQGPTGPQASQAGVVLLTLAPGIRGIGKLDRAIVSADTSFVEIRINLESGETANPQAYRVVVKTAAGEEEIWAQNGLPPQRYRSGQYVAVRVPAYRFVSASESHFALALGALAAGRTEYEEIENRYFQVVSK